MKEDVLALWNLKKARKGASKETLNHAPLIRLASGLDPLKSSREAYLRAYEALGIDIINRVPEENAPPPLEPGQVVEMGEGHKRSYLGLYDTVFRERYPFKDVDEFFSAGRVEPDYRRLLTPVPHKLDLPTIKRKEGLVGDRGIYYYMLYTTLFMWGVEFLGWDVFMMAVALDPERFKEGFLDRVFDESLRLIEELCTTDCPFVFCHDDLADARGPVFQPSWYERYIFPRYPELWKPVKDAGKKVIFVADGNMEVFLPVLRETGVDGVMLENPATPIERIIEFFGDRIIIGGVETGLLTFGSPREIRKHVLDVHEKTRGIAGFALSTPGGIHGNIPLENLEAYFDARVETGHTYEGWRAGGTLRD
ncbi:MAG TPA: uroporphyrinogen decarboxylase family protein [Spirochaetia bacterium]|nr:uroporphyrinogen decarboxylase family protein [Spirochaetia bacterium]